MSRFYMEYWLNYILTQGEENKNLQKHWPTETLQFLWAKVLTVECFRDCSMPSGGLIVMASFLSLLDMLRIIPTHPSLMPGHSQASKHNWCRGRETDKTATHSSALKVGQWTVLMHQSCSVPKTLNGKKE